MPDLLDLGEVMDQLSGVKDSDTGALARCLSTASDLITDMCLPLLPETVTDQLDGGQASVMLSRYPVTSVTSVTIQDSSGSTAVYEAGGTTGLVDGWRLNPDGGVLHRVGYRAWPLGWGNVIVTYTVGPDSVPPAVQEAALVLTQHLWQNRKISRSQPQPDPMGVSASYALPNKVIEMLRPYLKPARVA